MPDVEKPMGSTLAASAGLSRSQSALVREQEVSMVPLRCSFS